MAKRTRQIMELGKYIWANPFVCHGQPTFKGTRKMVHCVLEWLAQGKTVDELAAETALPREAIEEALSLAARAIREHYAVAPAPLHPSDDRAPAKRQKARAKQVR